MGNSDQRRSILKALFDLKSLTSGSAPIESFRRVAAIGEEDFDKAANQLNVAEIIRVSSERVELMDEDLVLGDYIESRRRLEFEGEQRVAVISSILSGSIRRSTKLMASYYRSASAIGLKGILERFEGQGVPRALFDRSAYIEQIKGRDPLESGAEISHGHDRFDLPCAGFSTHIEDYYPAISESIERERTAVCMMVQNDKPNSADEIFWLAVEVDSKLEATQELAEFWLDRLETAAIAAGFTNYKLWLVAPVGFDEEADRAIKERGAFGTSRAQVNMLIEILTAEPETKDPSVAEYEIVIPMGDSAELIAAHTLEEIAKRHGLRSHDINQIKTALVEACINASEHSHSPDRRIHQTFSVGPSSLTITITNRGVRLSDVDRQDDDSARRGWGLKLIEKLMDNVRYERTDDGTRIIMTKNLQPA
jgi:serine/threonine-protein kinase RsbW